MTWGTRAAFNPVTLLAAGSITNSYVLYKTFSEYTRILHFKNGTNQTVDISLDGVNLHVRLWPTGFDLYDISTNSIKETGLVFPKETKIYVKYDSVAPTTDYFWVQAIYAQGGI